jgi:NAD(P)H-dependent FMN reductase
MNDGHRTGDHDEQPLLQVVIASTRPGRVGLPVGTWMAEHAEKHGGFRVEVVDLATVDLPLFDEPEHPRLRRYTRPQTIAWSETVDRADAFVLVMPEYNHGFTAPLKNALDLLAHEWAHKPVGLVSYGGISGGLRAAQSIKPVLSALRMIPVVEAVPIPFVWTLLEGEIVDGHDERRFAPNEAIEAGADAMLDELVRVAPLARQLRAS